MNDKAVPFTLPNFISSNLRVLRKNKGWSQSELAERAGLNRGNIASYESGSAEPSICKLLRFSKLFGVNTRDITRRDLKDPAEMALAISNGLYEKETEAGRIEDFRLRAEKLAHLVDSSKELFDFKRESIADPCPQAEMLAAQYQQLHELTQRLLAEQSAFLKTLGCQCD